MSDSQPKIPLCPKHEKQVIFVCSFETCKQHRLICQICKQKETLHFSHHANYIYRFKEIKQFENTKRTIPKLEKGITQCENNIMEHKKFYAQQISSIKEDFAALKRQFNAIAQKYEQIYVDSFQKEIDKFDEQIANVKNILKQYIKEKNQQDSFFMMLFQNNQNNQNDQYGIEATIKKNAKAYKVRADIINLKSSFEMSRNNLIQYKKTEEDRRVLIALHDELDYFARSLFDKFRGVLGAEVGSNNDLKNNIATESKSLAMSRVSLGNLIDFQNDLKRSQTSSTYSSQRNLQRVQLPPLNPIVKSVRQKLKPIQPRVKGSIINEGPYLYSTGVYFGQFQNGKRQGWGQFVFHDGILYEGQWDKDTISGFGRLIRNDCYYEGNVKNGRANGSGNYEDHYRFYAGEWKNDKRNGIGEEQFKNKLRKYVGNFVDDKYNGKGKLITEQYTYEGKFKNGLFDGDGRIKFNNGQIFQGNFIQGQKNVGRHTYSDGSYYQGSFKDNLPHGNGQFLWADGLRYSGEWRLGIQDGIGCQFQPDGLQFKGVWKNGKWQKWI